MTIEFDIPDDRYYDATHHMWAQPQGGTDRVRVGIDALGLQSLGDLAYMSLRAVGDAVQRGEAIGTLEAAKMTGDLIAPVSGVLAARNEAALRDPMLVNDDPYGAGWMVAIQPRDWETESGKLVSGDRLPDWVAGEIERYRSQGWVE